MLSEFVERLRDLEDSSAFEQAMAQMVSDLGFERFAYAALGVDGSEPTKSIIVNYPLSWVCHYIEEDYLSFDPVIQKASLSFEPFLWRDIINNSDKELTNKQQRVLNEGSDFGLKQGATMPLHFPGGGVGMLSVTSRGGDKAFHKLWQEHALSLQTMTLYYHSAIERNICHVNCISEDSLTNIEREVLLWTARNKEVYDISDIIDLSVEEVCQVLKGAMLKLRTRTKQHAVIKAITNEVIAP